MTRGLELVVIRAKEQVSCLLLEDSRPLDLIRGSGPINRHDLYLARVNRVVPALAGVFLDLAAGQTALLPLKEAGPDVKAGQQLLVQVRQVKDPPKGHQVTTKIRLAGPFAVYRPGQRPLRRSKLQALAPDKAEALFARDLARLEKEWLEAEEASQGGPVPRLILSLGEPCHQALCSWAGEGLERIVTDDRQLYDQLYDLFGRLLPEKLPALHFWRPDHFSLAAAKGLADLDKLLTRKLIGLPGEGNIIIEKTEALTVIDVNSGSALKGQDEQQLRREINLAAAEMVAVHLKLRNIAGMVVIDFLRQDETGQDEVAQALARALAGDRGRTRLLGFSAMGLFELIRTPA